MRLEHMFQRAQVATELVATDCAGSFNELLLGACRCAPDLMGREQELLSAAVERRVVRDRQSQSTALLHLQHAEVRQPGLWIGRAPNGIRLSGSSGESPRLVVLLLLPARAPNPERLRRQARAALRNALRDREWVSHLLRSPAHPPETPLGIGRASCAEQRPKNQSEPGGIRWDLAMPYAHLAAELDRIEGDVQELGDLLQGCRSAVSDVVNDWEGSPHALPALMTHLTDLLTVAQEMLDAVGSASQCALRMDTVVKQARVSAFEH